MKYFDISDRECGKPFYIVWSVLWQQLHYKLSSSMKLLFSTRWHS